MWRRSRRGRDLERRHAIVKQGRSIAERLAGSIKLDDRELIDEIIESDLYANFNDRNYYQSK